MSFGVEGGSDKVLRALRKDEKMATIEQGIKNACELGYNVNLFFLVGSPMETWADFMQSVDLALRYPIFRVNFYNIIPYPYTPLFHWLTERDYLLAQPEEYLNYITSNSETPVFTTPKCTSGKSKGAPLCEKHRAGGIVSGYRPEAGQISHWRAACEVSGLPYQSGSGRASYI